MTNLSVNLNKIALLRNSRGGDRPSVVGAARVCIAQGAAGITVHPRPDQRHIRPGDVRDLAGMLTVEFNIEGNPLVPEWMDLVREVRPTQATLVPDEAGALTSDHGWNLERDGERLRPIIEDLQSLGIRVSLFLDPDPAQVERAAALGADRIELYTKPYADAYGGPESESMLELYRRAAQRAGQEGLGVNAGHDLNRENLADFCTIPEVQEVSIGHALICDALEIGLPAAVRDYLDAIQRGRSRIAR